MAIYYSNLIIGESDWSKEFQQLIQGDNSASSVAEQNWATEFSEFTDSDFEKFLEGQKEKVVGADSAYTVSFL